jgi:hypothetical protein
MSKSLPRRTACGAPEFDGKALSLKRYWEDIEEVTETCDRQTNAEKMKITFQYINQSDELLWKGVLPANGN